MVITQNLTVLACLCTCAATITAADVFPGETWEARPAAELGMDGAALAALSESLGGRGCVIRRGYVVHSWGDQAERGDWASSAKPVLSTLLFFAIQEGKLDGVDYRLADLGWPLAEKDRPMAFVHLANMISGYARPEPPGEAWAYNDYAIQLYQQSLFDRVFKEPPLDAACAPNRLGALGFQDGLKFRSSNRRMSASVRDFARIAWFWRHKGRWGDRQLLPRRFFDEYQRPYVPKDLPDTRKADTNDYLGIGTYGGGSDHFSRFGPGIYGFNWWFNATGRLHPDTLTWPDAPKDTFMSVGARGNNSAVIPSLDLVLVSARGDWGELEPANPDSKFNRHLNLLVSAVRDGSAASRVEQWAPFTASFSSVLPHENPFLPTFSATVNRPDGTSFETPGFYDGEGAWKVRVGPDMPGKWTLTTHSGDSQLDGKEEAFDCVAATSQHGPLRVDPDHPHHFVHADGTRFFHLGYECDWLWALDMDKLELPVAGPFLDKLAAHGFNLVVLNVFAYDCDWRKGTTGPDDYGPPAMLPWPGPNDAPDHTRLNLPFWQHYDRIIQAMYDRGIQAHIMIKVYNKMVNWPAKNSEAEDLYLRTLVARYAAYPNVIWDFSKEAHRDKDVEYKLGYMRRLKDLDPYHRLMTNHDDDALYNKGAFDGLLDLRSDQQHNKWHETILKQRARHSWPAVNIEFGYEWGAGGEKDCTYDVVQSAEENSRRAWLICMAGGYPVYYYTYTAWDVIRPDDRPLGYAYMRTLCQIFERIGYWEMEPADDLVDTGYCLANPGKEYLVYLEKGGPVTVQLQGAGKPMQATWLHTFVNEFRDAGTVPPASVTLTPPGKWAVAPLALWIHF